MGEAQPPCRTDLAKIERLATFSHSTDQGDRGELVEIQANSE